MLCRNTMLCYVNVLSNLRSMEFVSGSETIVLHSAPYPLSDLRKLFTSLLSFRAVICNISLMSCCAGHMQGCKERTPRKHTSRAAGAKEVIARSLPSSHPGTEKTTEHKGPLQRRGEELPFHLCFHSHATLGILDSVTLEP